MKTKFKKAMCFSLSICITMLLTITAFAIDAEFHVHGDNCIYNCELDVINPTNMYSSNHGHIDHENSDECKYSCTHNENYYTEHSHSTVISEEKLQSILTAYRSATTDEELEEIIAECYGIPVSEVDIVELRNFIDAGNIYESENAPPTA